MKLQIICRGSQREGLGHLFRTKTFAKAARRSHDVHVCAIVETELRSLLSDLGEAVSFFENDSEVVPSVVEFAPDVVLFDTTTFDRGVFGRLRDVPLLTASLSPIFDLADSIDMLFSRESTVASQANVKVYAGLEYAIFSEHCEPIDDEFFERAVKSPALPIAVAMGGADAANKTLSVVRALSSLPKSHTIWVILGEGYGHSYTELVNSARMDFRHEILLAKTNRSLWRVMSNCALAVLAGGLTTIEAIHAGLPTVNLFETEAHGQLMTSLFEANVAINGGLFSEDSLATMKATIQLLDGERSRLRDIRRATAGLVDNRGSERVIQVIERAVLDKAVTLLRSPDAARES